MKKRKAVFLDRDGTINIEKEYLYKIEDFEFIPGVPEAIRRLKKAGYLVIVVTNQSGVARGYYGLEEVDLLHEYIQEELRAYNTSVDAFYVCPHHPEKGLGKYKIECSCRKSNPGMILQAAKDYDIDLSCSYMIGDKLTDIEAGVRAGCIPVLVLTGYGKSVEPSIDVASFCRCLDLFDATSFILNN